ncbi:MAG: S-layer homology domain-containing protein [Syntrophomonadaceae bacterium]|nr:S-layer homology domain-containing protein [Syntrophomonadaceae bacterium]
MKTKVTVLLFALLLFIWVAPAEVLAANAPFTLEAPQNLKVELKYDQNNWPYFALTLDVPQGVQAINHNLNSNNQYYAGTNSSPVKVRFEFKYGQYDWNQGPSLYDITEVSVDDLLAGNTFNYYPYEEEDALGGIDIKAETYSFRALFYSSWGYADSFVDKEVKSDYSNLVTLGNPAQYRGASDWARDGLDKAIGYGFITDRIKDNMSGPITREEFAEVAVKLYELYTGKQAEAADPSTFTDTNNREILKAYQLGIVAGIGNNQFAPQVLINREQMAAMLYRSVGAIKPDADMSIAGAPTFADEKDIESYFINNVKFMAKNGFINGVGNNKFAPKATSTREQAVLVAVRVYETYAKK